MLLYEIHQMADCEIYGLVLKIQDEQAVVLQYGGKQSNIAVPEGAFWQAGDIVAV